MTTKKVRVESSPDGSVWSLIAQATTGIDGRFSVNWKPRLEGQVQLRATFAGNKKYTAAVSNVVVQQVDAAVLQAPPTRRVGVNYITLYHRYDTPTETLQRDFARFKADGISAIVIVMMWYRLEGAKGVYNQQFINNVIRVSNVAAQYGIEVMIDFHTLIGSSDAWSNPSYVGVGMNLILNSDIASAYVAMVQWAVTQLKDVPNIWSYAVLNEPWFWPLDEWRKTAWINLTVELSGVVKQVTGKPVTVRYVAALFERDWTWDARLLGVLDFISLNAYVSESTTNNVYWNNFDEYRAGLTSAAEKAATLGKLVQVTEFGYSTGDDAVQSNMYQTYTEIFKGIANLVGWLSWGWDCSYDQYNPSWTAISSYSIVIQSSGIARPAYVILAQNH